jgi:hypothetical protein
MDKNFKYVLIAAGAFLVYKRFFAKMSVEKAVALINATLGPQDLNGVDPGFIVDWAEAIKAGKQNFVFQVGMLYDSRNGMLAIAPNSQQQ